MSLSQRSLIVAATLVALFLSTQALKMQAQANYHDELHESAREDKFTRGAIERARLEAGQPDLKITVNVPAFRLTLWQNGREVKTYQIGVGMREYPIAIGQRVAQEIIWNPAWIPPASDWVATHKGVAPGDVIEAGDPRNPLGKLKIPLGDGYLIHQAAQPNDLGHLVSHGCIRMLQTDLYDLAEKIVFARALPVTKQEIARAKATHETLDAKLDAPLPVEIDYDTMVVEDGILHLYPDVYAHGSSTVANLRAELNDNGVNAARINDDTLQQMLDQVSRAEEFVVEVESLKRARALTDGRTQPLITRFAQSRATAKKRSPRRL